MDFPELPHMLFQIATARLQKEKTEEIKIHCPMQQTIIDTHVHISYLEKGHRSLFEVKKDLLKSMQQHGISRSIVIPDNVSNPRCADMDSLWEIIEGEKNIIAMGTVYIFHKLTEQVRRLDRLLQSKKICAIKLFPGHDPFYPTDKRCELVYRLCQRHKVPVLIHTGANSGNMACARFNDPKYIVKIAKKYPKLSIVLAHYFWPRMEYCYALTIGYDNIFYDTSAMADPEVLAASGGWAMSKKILEETMMQKPHSVVFGTDWPMCPVDKHIKLINALQVSQEQQEMIFSRNAINLYKLTAVKK